MTGRSGIPPAGELERALHDYPAVIERQGVARLPELDRWYREELPEAIAAREPAHITRAELVRLTEWKMARGVWRARNLVLVRGNEEDAVREASSEGFAAIPHPTRPIARLARLAGVGPATASAAVAAVAGDRYPFFDEIVAARLPGLGPVAWTLGYYRRYADSLAELADQLGGDWTPEALGRALWAHAGGKAGAEGMHDGSG